MQSILELAYCHYYPHIIVTKSSSVAYLQNVPIPDQCFHLNLDWEAKISSRMNSWLSMDSYSDFMSYQHDLLYAVIIRSLLVYVHIFRTTCFYFG